MAVINSGLVPKALSRGLAGSPSSVSPQPQPRQPQLRQARQALPQVLPRSKGGLLGVIRKAARNQLAGHNCGGAAHHNGSAMAYPIGKG